MNKILFVYLYAYIDLRLIFEIYFYGRFYIRCIKILHLAKINLLDDIFLIFKYFFILIQIKNKQA
ncbi:hypothetical protein BpHYR1_026888 [Brachionus plicatilis]|uniref:Uncharacterized protein n=1 Tax=Brachionus plicatilis TaxID=10195 RepID=A0A3M7T8Q2_BRAPC|nr:hypothetical protein BpHYR1_026888 [Brachionus plicatilis]